LEAWATPQELAHFHIPSAESAIQNAGCFSSNFLLGLHRNESRFQRWGFEMHQFLGRCPRLKNESAPLALNR
jgi:hypothetical protein